MLSCCILVSGARPEPLPNDIVRAHAANRPFVHLWLPARTHRFPRDIAIRPAPRNRPVAGISFHAHPSESQDHCGI